MPDGANLEISPASGGVPSPEFSPDPTSTDASNNFINSRTGALWEGVKTGLKWAPGANIIGAIALPGLQLIQRGLFSGDSSRLSDVVLGGLIAAGGTAAGLVVHRKMGAI
ncbi:MAG: hypothetical protein HY426_04240 [Candidatus Levybacteria bacterium]|nr:hypothetical protein [Candidatus Levybacteria bacterium]